MSLHRVAKALIHLAIPASMIFGVAAHAGVKLPKRKRRKSFAPTT